MKIPGMGKMMQQMQKIQKAEQELNATEIIGEAGAGMAKVTLNGKKECSKVEIDSSLLSDDKEMLEDIIAAAFNDASHKVDSERESKMSGLTSGLNIPGGLDSLLK